MRKVLFTESQMKKILESEGLDSGLAAGGGYLDPDDGAEESTVASGKEVFVDPTNAVRGGNVVIGDKIARSKKPGNGRYGFNNRSSYSAIQEDIDNEKFIYNKFQKNAAAATGTKMGQNIASTKDVSDGTQRKRKHDLQIQRNKLGKEEFEKKYGPIAKTIASSLTQMSNMNNIKNGQSDLSKLNDVNDVNKVKTKVEKGHHKDGEELNNGILHYYN